MKKIILVSLLSFSFGSYATLTSGLTLNLDYSTYLGGSNLDQANGISVGTDGRAYVTGFTKSSDFPTGNSYQAINGGHYNVFVSALSSTGSVLAYSTYLGGSGSDIGRGISVGTNGMAYVTGQTSSDDFPLKNPYQDVRSELFVSALSSSGSALVYSTYLGGSGSLCLGDGSAQEICVGTDGKAYIIGYTKCSDFPTKNPYQGVHGGGSSDAFVSAFSSSGSALVYSTYLGGSDLDWGMSISLGTDGMAYVTGFTKSSDFPTENPYQAVLGDGNGDAFVSAFSSSGSALVYSTYLGGNVGDCGWGICLGPDGSAYVTGGTTSADFPTKNPYQATYRGGNRDVFVSALSSSGSVLSYSTYLGGSGHDDGNGISVGTNGMAYVAGKTFSADFPTKNPYQAIYGGDWDVFVTALSSTGSALSYSTYLGGSDRDQGYGIGVGTDGAVYVTGYTESSDFPTENPYQAVCGSDKYDAFVSRLFLTITPSQLSIDSGDYNGNGKADIAIFRSITGLWAVRGLGRVYYGRKGDIPVSGDYDGDGIADIAIYRPSNGLWEVKYITRLYFGGRTDLPVPRDYTGDGTCDVAFFNQISGLWRVRGITAAYYGADGDLPIPDDYDGDGNADLAIFRASNGMWAVKDYTRWYYGTDGDIPVPGVYKWYGREQKSTWKTQCAIFRPTTGLWAIKGITRFYLGGSETEPVVADFDGNSLDNIGVFRASSGLWAILRVSRVYFGATGDVPTTR